MFNVWEFFIRSIWLVKIAIILSMGLLGLLFVWLWKKFLYNPIKNLYERLKPKLISSIENLFNLVKEIKLKHHIISTIMFLISILVFFLYILLKEVIENNFGDPSWFNLKVILMMIILFIFIFLWPLLSLFRKYDRFVLSYLFFPILFLTFFVLNERGYFSKLLFMSVLLGAYILYLIALRFFWSPPKKKLLISIFVIILLLNIGTAFIDGYVGEKTLKFNLNDCSGSYNQIGKIICKDRLGHVIAGNEVLCSLEENRSCILFEKGIIQFIYSDGTNSSINVSGPDSFSFVIPENLSNIYLEFRRHESCLSTGVSIRYPTYAEFKSNQRDFMYLLLGLLCFCLISVPIIIQNFSAICKD